MSSNEDKDTPNEALPPADTQDNVPEPEPAVTSETHTEKSGSTPVKSGAKTGAKSGVKSGPKPGTKSGGICRQRAVTPLCISIPFFYHY